MQKQTESVADTQYHSRFDKLCVPCVCEFDESLCQRVKGGWGLTDMMIRKKSCSGAVMLCPTSDKSLHY